MSAHLVHIEGDKWKNLRAKLTPTFSSAKLKMMVPTILNVAEHFKDTLNKDIQKNSVVEMKDLLARFTTDIIGEFLNSHHLQLTQIVTHYNHL